MVVVDAVDLTHDADVLAAAAEAVGRSGAHAVEQFSDFAEMSKAIGDLEASKLWSELAEAAARMVGQLGLGR